MGQRRTDFEKADKFWKNYSKILEQKHEKEYLILERANIPRSTMATARARNSFPHAVYIHSLAKALNIRMEDFFSESDNGALLNILDDQGKVVEGGDEIVLIPIFAQTVSAGPGQEFFSSTEIVGQLPFLKRMLRGINPTKARALEVRGDSMTGIQLFDGDIVVFVPGSIRGDGIYVLRVGDEIIVKRVEFDNISRKIRIMSENPRYPDRIESADGQTVEVVGKVYGWVHAHPY